MFETRIISNAVNCPIFTPCGEYLIGTKYKYKFSSYEKVLYTYHLSTKKLRNIEYGLLPDAPNECLLSHCGRYLFMTYFTNCTMLSMMNLQNCHITNFKHNFLEMPTSILFSPDENCIYYLLNNTKSRIKCICLKTEYVTTIYESNDHIDCMILSPNSTSLFVTNHSNDSIEEVCLTNAIILKSYCNLFPKNILLSKCGSMILFSSYKDRGIQSINLNTNKKSYFIRSRKVSKHGKFKISPDGKTLITTNLNCIIKKPLPNNMYNFKKLQILQHSHLSKSVVQNLLK